jgi:hypothetical protein
MRRFVGLVLALACVSAVSARAGSIGLGAFGGTVYPVLQKDLGNGTLYGVRVPVSLVPFLGVEPYWASSTLGDKVQTVAGLSHTFPGYDQTAYGANLLLATGGPLSFYPLAGVGKVTLKSGSVDKSYTTYNAGFGLSVSAVPKLAFHLRGEMQAVVEGKTTHKFANVTAGASYALFGVPLP